MNKRVFKCSGRAQESGRPARQGVAVMTVLASVLVLAGCSTTRVAPPAPVESRGGAPRPAEVVVMPGAENAGVAQRHGGSLRVMPGPEGRGLCVELALPIDFKG